MNNIKYVVVCKNGYCFAYDKDEVLDFIKRHGVNIAYYIGYFEPVTDIAEFLGLNTNTEDLGAKNQKK